MNIPMQKKKIDTLLHDCNFGVQETRQRSKDLTLAQQLVAYGLWAAPA